METPAAEAVAGQSEGSDANSEAEAAERAVFDDLVKQQDEEASTEGKVAEVPPTQDAPSKEQTPSKSEGESPQPDKGESQNEDDHPDGFDRALQGHMRSSARSEEEIEALYRDDPERFMDLGEKLSKMQGDQDRMGQQYRELEKGTEGKASTENERGEGTEADPAPDSEATGISDVIERIKDNPDWDIEQLGENLDELIKAARSDTIEELEPTINELKSEILSMRQLQEKDRIETVNGSIDEARKNLSERFPDLLEDEVHEAVLKDYDIITEARPELSNPAEVYAKAVAMQDVRDGAMDALKTKMLNRNEARKNGRPTVASASSGNRTLTPDQAEEQEFLQLHHKYYGDTG
jgi:ribosomal protein L29